jgi:hypothetical protein
MKKLPKIFLFLAVVSFAFGASELGDNWLFYIGRPVGAIFFVLFMIFQFLKNETALYDEEQRAKIQVPDRQLPRAATARPGVRLTQPVRQAA